MLFAGVPEGNRTLVTAATERRSTIELRAPWLLKNPTQKVGIRCPFVRCVIQKH